MQEEKTTGKNPRAVTLIGPGGVQRRKRMQEDNKREDRSWCSSVEHCAGTRCDAWETLHRFPKKKTSTSLVPKSEFQNIESSSRDFSFTRESQFFPRIHEQSRSEPPRVQLVGRASGGWFSAGPRERRGVLSGGLFSNKAPSDAVAAR